MSMVFLMPKGWLMKNFFSKEVGEDNDLILVDCLLKGVKQK